MNVQRTIATMLALGLVATVGPAVSFASQDASAEECDPSEGDGVDTHLVDLPPEAREALRYATGAADCAAEQCDFQYDNLGTPDGVQDVRYPNDASCTLEASSTQKACEIDPANPGDYVQCQRDKCEIYGDEWKPPLPDRKPFDRLTPGIPVPNCTHLQ